MPVRDEDCLDYRPTGATIVIIHHDEHGAVRYWTGQGWTADRTEASEFSTFAAANLERNRARKAYPGMRIVLDGETGGGE